MSSAAAAKPKQTVYALHLVCSPTTIAKVLKQPAELNPSSKPKEFSRFNPTSGAQASHAWFRNSKFQQQDNKPINVDPHAQPTVQVQISFEKPDDLILWGEKTDENPPECLWVDCKFSKRHNWHGDQQSSSPFVDAHNKEVVHFHRAFTFRDRHTDSASGMLSWTMPLDAQLRLPGPDDKYSFTVKATMYFDNKGKRRAVTFQQDPGMCTKPKG